MAKFTFNAKKFKYGTSATVLTVVFIAVVVLINTLTTAWNNYRPMTVDMTKNKVFAISDATKTLLAPIKTPVTIVFFMPIDQYEQLYDSSSGDNGKMIVECIRAYAREFSNVKIQSIDIIKNPDAAKEYKNADATQIATTSIAVKGDYGYRVLSFASFFGNSSNTGMLFGFYGEMKMTSTIMNVTSPEKSVVCFTTQHGEAVNPIDPAVQQMFTAAGFDIQTIDLTTEDIPADCKILVILDPTTDFTGADPNNPNQISEIDKVNQYLGNFGSVMYFTDPNVRPLPELEALLAEWGISFMHGALISDPKNSISTDGFELISQYSLTYDSDGNVDTTPSNEIVKNVATLPSARTIVTYAEPINILFSSKDNTSTSVVLATYPTAVATQDNQTVLSNTPIPLMVLAERGRYITDGAGNQDYKSGYVLACGSSQFLSSSFLLSNSFRNQDILFNAMRVMGMKNVPSGLTFKVVEDESLNISQADKYTWTVVIMTVLPLITLITGLVIWLKRRNS